MASLCAKLVQALNGMGSRYDSPANMVADDLLLRFSIFYYGVAKVTYKYYLVSSVAFRGGRQPASQSYCHLDVVGGAETPLNHALLKIAQHPHVLQDKTWPNPIDRGSDEFSGCPITVSTEKLAADIAQMKLDSTLESIYPYKVVIRKMKFRDVSRTLLQVTDPDATWNPIMVSIPHQQQVGGEVKVSERIEARPKAKRKATEIDLLNFGADLDLVSMADVGTCEPDMLVDTEEPFNDQDSHLDDNKIPCREEIMEQLLAALDVQIDSDGDLGLVKKHVEDFAGLLSKGEIEALDEVDKVFANDMGAQPTLEVSNDSRASRVSW